jgi:hypothetical protein
MMIVGSEHEVIENSCPSCGKKLNATNCVGADNAPSEGDFTVCMYCGHLMAFGKNLQLRELTDEEMIDIAGDARILAVQKARSMVMKDDLNDQKH